MRLYIFFFSIFWISTGSCQGPTSGWHSKKPVGSKIQLQKIQKTQGTTVKTRFPPPRGFSRVVSKPTSFAHYLQNFPLKPVGAQVHLYNGALKYRQDIHSAVLDIDVGKRDLQQCADATMRLRAEYLYHQKQFDKIHFNFTNGFNASYAKWRLGYRIKVSGNTVRWVYSGNPSVSYESFRRYLTMVFSYAGTLSLSKELVSVSFDALKIGDLFIQGGSPGHAIIVMDMAKDKDGNTVFLLAQSYMPAQEIHILKNPNNARLSPWYSLKETETLITPEWHFTTNDIKGFE